MKNFNIDNFKLYAKWDLTLNQKFYRNIGFVYLFAILGIVLVSFFIRWFLYSVGYPSNIYSGVSITSLILHGLTTYALMISSGCVFHPLRNKQGRITNLTIPASSFEKYAWHLLICIIGTYVISFIGLVLADGMNALMTLAIFGADSIMSITVAWFDISRDMITLKGLEEMQLADQIIVEAAVFFGWSFTFLYWSIYTYGNSIKPQIRNLMTKSKKSIRS